MHDDLKLFKQHASQKTQKYRERLREVSFKSCEPYGAQTQQLHQGKEELRQTRFPITLFFTLVQLCSCANFVTFTALKIIFIYV